MMELERFTPRAGQAGELHAQHLSRYEFALSRVKGRKVVDVACGTGYGSRLLADGGALRVTGIDLSAEAIEGAKRDYGREGISFLEGDVSRVREAGRVDCVVSFETIEHLAEPESLLIPVRDVLVDDGLFIVSTPVRSGGSLSDRPVNPFHVREWNEEEFDVLLGRFFRNREFRYQYVYRKRPYPLSRTLNRLILKGFYPGAAAGFDAFPVRESPWELPATLVARGYMVVVCSGRTR